jgi:hypothetical protein
MHFFLCSHTHISMAISFPDHRASPDLLRSFCSPSTAAHAASHPRPSAPRAPPPPTGAPQPAQSRSCAPERPDHYAGELELPPPLGLTVVPLIHRLLALAKHIISTTSSRRSCLATSPPPSCSPATETPMTFLGPPPPAPVRRRYAATAPLCLNPGHPRDRRELLGISPHLPLAAGELSCWNSIGIDRTSCVVQPGTQLRRFKCFQGLICEKAAPLSKHKSTNL